MKLTLVILAAGMGSRYGGLKQLDTFGVGEHALMEYSVFDAKKAGFEKIIFVIRKDFEIEFKSRIGSRIEQEMEVSYAFQDMHKLPAGFICPSTREKPWGTGHAVLAAKELIDGPFAVINADDFYGRESYQVLADFLKSHNQNCIVGYQLSEVLSDFGTVSRGMCELDDKGNLKAIHETKKIYKSEGKILAENPDGTTYELNPQDLCSMNMMGFTKASLEFYEKYFIDFLEKNLNEPKTEFYMPEVITRLINEEGESVPVLPTTAKWFGVTYQEDKAATSTNIDALIAKGIYPKHLRA